MEGGERTSKNQDTVHDPNVVESPSLWTTIKIHPAVALFENVNLAPETLNWQGAKRVPTCLSPRRELFIVEVGVLGESKAFPMFEMAEVPKNFWLFRVAKEHL